MQRLSSLFSLPLTGLSDGRFWGTVTDILISLAEQRIIALRTETQDIAYQAVQTICPQGIVIDDAMTETVVDAGISFQAIRQDRLYDAEGICQGSVGDMLFDLTTGHLEKTIVSNGWLLDFVYGVRYIDISALAISAKTE